MDLHASSTWLPLPRDQVVKAVERKGPVRIPLVWAKWWGEGLEEQYGARLQAFDRYPEDATVLLIETLDGQSMGLSWETASPGCVAGTAGCVAGAAGWGA